MKPISIDSLRVASPCPANWETMKGDDRVRFCDLCSLHVYNFAELTRKEIDQLVADTEGRLCGRLYRRADGTLITRDCPVGLRALRRRVVKSAGAVLAMLMGLSSLAFGQKASKAECQKQVTITRKIEDTNDERGIISGVVLDATGAVIRGARVTVTDSRSRVSVFTESNDQGEFRVSGLPPSNYDVQLESAAFAKLKLVKIQLAAKQNVRLESILLPDVTVLVGVIAYSDDPMLEPGKLVIKSDMIHRIPR